MPKHKSPFSSIASLRGLQSMYNIAKSIPVDRITEKQYLDVLQKNLISDKIGVSDKSKNFLAKFVGWPAEASSEDATGIETSILDGIVKVVYKKLGLQSIFTEIGEIESHDFPYVLFEDVIFPTPDFLQPFNDRRYYRYLNEEDQMNIDGYVNRRLHELNLIPEKTITYLVYMWNHENREFRNGILVLNDTTNTAVYSYYEKNGDELEAKLVMRSDIKRGGISYGSSTMYIDLWNEDPSKHHMRLSFILSVLDINFRSLSYLKGILATSGKNSTMPLAVEVVLVRQASFIDAYKIIKDPTLRESNLSLEVMLKRLDIPGINISSPDKLNSSPLHGVLQEIKGHYIMYYLTLEGSARDKGKLVKGICHLAEDGIVTFRLGMNSEIKGYIDQQIFRGNRFLQINYFISKPCDPLDTTYKLGIERNYDKGGHVVRLFGIYNSIYNSTLYKGSILFKKLEGPGCKRDWENRYLSTKDAFSDNINAALGEDSVIINEDKLTLDDEDAIVRLMQGTYDYEYEVDLPDNIKAKIRKKSKSNGQ